MADSHDTRTVPKRGRRNARQAARMRPATKDQRAAIHFDAIDFEFDWTNEEWAIAHLPYVRLALVTMKRDDVALEPILAGLAKEGHLPELLDDWVRTRDHLKAIAELIDNALGRSFLVLERLGYDPVVNLPPERAQPLH